MNKLRDGEEMKQHSDNDMTDGHDSQVNQEITDAPRKISLFSSKKKMAVIGAVVVVLAVVIIAVVIWLIGKKPLAEKADTTVTAALSDADRTVTSAFISVDEEPFDQATMTSAIGGQTEEGSVLYDFAPYMVSGTSFYSLPHTGAGKTISVASSDAESRYSALGESLKSSGLKSIDASPTSATGLKLNEHVTVAAYAIYASDQTICSLARLTARGTSQDKQLLTMGCAAVVDYKRTATAAKPFYAAYTKAINSSGRVTLGPAEIKEEGDTKRATVFLIDNGKAGVHTYTQAKGTEWVYEKAL